MLNYLADQVAAYEEEHTSIPEAEPKEVLRLLLEQHGLKQDDLADCAPQGRISDILNGKRGISKDIAKRARETVPCQRGFVPVTNWRDQKGRSRWIGIRGHLRSECAVIMLRTTQWRREIFKRCCPAQGSGHGKPQR
nr:hypothetical protein [Ferrimicrobium acidiphilum]